jgi:hypothetical protein
VNPTTADQPRPREVTLAGFQAVVGSVLALVLLIGAMQQLDSAEVREALAEIVAGEDAQSLGLTLETARTLLRYAIMVLAVLSAASLVLGIYVLRRHRASRIALTVVGGVAAVLCVLAGVTGLIMAGYIALSVGLLWTRAARSWFADPNRRPPEPPAPGPWPPLPPPGPPGPPPGP